MHREDIVFPKKIEKRMSSPDFMAEIKSTEVPINKVALWFLGQNSWILKDSQGTIFAIDPYLTDYCATKRQGGVNEKSRLLPIFIEPEDLEADMVLITHSHPDHADPYTLERLKIKEKALFAAPFQAIPVLQEAGISRDRIKQAHPKESWEWKGVEIMGTFALPTDITDLNHMGFLLKFSNGKVYYNSGDTAKCDLLRHVREANVDFMTICINGGYHNLSHWEAAEITALINPKTAIPAHYDMMPHNVQPPHMFKKSLSMHAPDVNYYLMEYYEASFF